MANINITFFVRAADSTLEAEYQVQQQSVSSKPEAGPVAVPEMAGDLSVDRAAPALGIRVEIQEKKSDM